MDPEQLLLSPLAFEEREDEFQDTYFLEVDATLKYYMLEIKRTLGTKESKAIVQNFLPDLIDILDIKQKQAFVQLLAPKLKELYYLDLHDKIMNYEINSDSEFLKFCNLLTFLEYRYVDVLGKIFSHLPLNKLKRNPRTEIDENLTYIYDSLKGSQVPEWLLDYIKFLPRDLLVDLLTKLTTKYLIDIVTIAIISKEVR